MSNAQEIYFVKATQRGFVQWQGYQKASSSKDAIETAQMYRPQIVGASWTARPTAVGGKK